MERTRRTMYADDVNVAAGAENITKEKKYKREKAKPYQIILMVITLVIAVFVVIQVVHMVNYTLGNEMDVNKMWLYKWVLNLGN